MTTPITDRDPGDAREERRKHRDPAPCERHGIPGCLGCDRQIWEERRSGKERRTIDLGTGFFSEENVRVVEKRSGTDRRSPPREPEREGPPDEFVMAVRMIMGEASMDQALGQTWTVEEGARRLWNAAARLRTIPERSPEVGEREVDVVARHMLMVAIEDRAFRDDPPLLTYARFVEPAKALLAALRPTEPERPA